ncbi:MAG: hypothetical protein L3K01_02895, partial [Thermoplasmata archaeon]|nr:hypothetical protein [Thermoplasmata archaeon]
MLDSRIAILGWGSLVWDPRNLAFEKTVGWNRGGPLIALEFSRKSRDGRLTLVLDSDHGSACPTRFATSALLDLGSAVRDLASREGMRSENSVGFVELKSGHFRSRNEDTGRSIAAWGRFTEYSHVIWTDLPPSDFFTLNWGIRYLESLGGETLRLAREYVLRAPEEVETPLRSAMRA